MKNITIKAPKLLIITLIVLLGALLLVAGANELAKYNNRRVAINELHKTAVSSSMTEAQKSIIMYNMVDTLLVNKSLFSLSTSKATGLNLDPEGESTGQKALDEVGNCGETKAGMDEMWSKILKNPDNDINWSNWWAYVEEYSKWCSGSRSV
jgi:hypothetical protein